MPDDLVTRLADAIQAKEDKARRAGVQRPEWAYDRETFRVLTAEGQARLTSSDGSPHPDRWVIASRGMDQPLCDVDGEHIADNDPQDTLRRCAADRKLIERYHHALDERRRHPEDLATAGALLTMVGVLRIVAEGYGLDTGERT